MEHKIRIINEVSLKQGATPDEGMPIYEKIISFLADGDTVNLDFEQVDLVTTAFLNVVIGKLYEKYDSSELKRRIKFSNLTKGIALRIKKVADYAKVYYLDQAKFNKNVDSVLYGND